MNSQEKPESFMEKVKFTTTLLIFLAKIFSLPLDLFLHEDVGERYIGLAGAFSFVLLVVWPLFFPASSPAPIYLLLFAFVIRSAVHNIISSRRLLRLEKLEYTRRSGTPLLARLVPHWSPARLAWLEPAAVLVLGMVVIWISKPLGTYLMLASMGIFGLLMVHKMHLANEMADMSDAAHLQRYKGELFRQMQGQ